MERVATEICKFGPDEGYEWVEINLPPASDPVAQNLLAAKTASLGEWEKRPAVRITQEHGRHLKAATIPSLSFTGHLLLTPEVTPTLRPILEPYGEFLPVDLEGGEAWIFHCLTIVDALDVAACEPFYSPGDPERMLSFDVQAFRPGVVPEGCVFTLPENQTSRVYWTRGIVDAITDSVEVSGIYFYATWTEAEGPLPRRRRIAP